MPLSDGGQSPPGGISNVVFFEVAIPIPNRADHISLQRSFESKFGRDGRLQQ
jgi:hypothetical protein